MEDIILQYEKDFFCIEFCNCRENLERRFANSFFEFGKSGVVHDRECVINALMSLSEDRAIEITQFELNILSKYVLSAHYISHHKNEDLYALRTSIWKFENDEWKLYFHQGTPCQQI